MMSKRLFFKAMAEEMRHKSWMVALSFLGYFLALVVPFLVMRSNPGYWYLGQDARGTVEYMAAFMREYVLISGGILAILGAFITGISSFRYLFHKSQTDAWHSFPIRRRTLYGVCYLNGFLIWFVPMLCNVLITGGLAGSVAYSAMGQRALLEIWKETGITLAVFVVVFLLIYNLVLVGVMLSGNVLNAIVSTLILGAGAISVYGLGLGFTAFYLDTYYGGWVNAVPAVYGSPLVSAVYLLARGIDRIWEPWWKFAGCLLDHLLIAAILGGCAFFLYKRRPSELAEQGVRNKAFSALMRILAGVVAGMFGWLLFVMLVDNYRAVGWGIFGTLLAGVLVSGVLDMIFSMEFKAFFAHWIQMAGTVALALVVCFIFCYDLTGYDSYLPDKEQIAQIAVCDLSLGNRNDRWGADRVAEVLADMCYTDVDAAYSFLERVTEREARDGEMIWYAQERIVVKVTLKSGRKYCREYTVTDLDWDVVAPLVCSETYLEQNYQVNLEEEPGVLGLGKTMAEKLSIEEEEVIRRILEAYNRDILEQQPKVLQGEGGRVLFQMYMTPVGQNHVYRMYVYEKMEHTLSALEEAGYGWWLAVLEPEDVEWIELPLGYYSGDRDWSREELIAIAEKKYGVSRETGSEVEEGAEETAATRETFYAETVSTKDGEDMSLMITDPVQIGRILEIAGYERDNSNIFQPEAIYIYYQGKDGSQRTLYLPKGSLPEEFIQKFGELAD